ncbi:hypothetical protein BC628DRAFT_1423820 [Trametes gibbosa]|uniref:Zinc finger protein 201 n=1 Tax=Trametes gibbosa TaxID=160864 RepID=A0A6B9KI39_9APHY|nr:hypothetical protein BC628DRAFT_1423820 [Trametes gibbosa]QHA24574.1 zinc finger protein 201 [Trametes gibbosa]
MNTCFTHASVPSPTEFTLDVDEALCDYASPTLTFTREPNDHDCYASDLIDWSAVSMASPSSPSSDPWAVSSRFGSEYAPPSLISDTQSSVEPSDSPILAQDWVTLGGPCDVGYDGVISPLEGLHGYDASSAFDCGLQDGVRGLGLEQNLEDDPFSTYMYDSPQSPACPVGEACGRSSSVSVKMCLSVDPVPTVIGKKPSKRRQDTARKHACPVKGCDAEFSRRNNLTAHTDSVHKGVRPFACEDGACHERFARRHDATRHYQSKHTTLGSPRRKPTSSRRQPA